MPLAPGTKLGHFEIVVTIGEGGMGEVYRARDNKLDRDVAIKVIRPDAVESSERRERFVREAKATAVLNHPNVATVYEIDEADGLTFIAMELIEGDSLSDLIARGRLSTDRAVEIAIGVAEGLSAAHAKSIVHRDLKPANIMILDDGRPKIIDFGLVKLLETGSEGETATKAQAMVGTVAYMSPEQARSEDVDHRSDIFSLGIVLHEMLTGSQPFAGPSAPETLNDVINAPPPRLPSVLASLQPVLDRCLAKEPAARYSSARELSDALHNPATEKTERRDSADSTNKWPWVLAGVALIIAAATLLTRDGDAPRGTPRIANPALVTRAVGVENHPAWSPDGEMLAYSASTRPSLFGGNWDIWVLQVRGEQPLNRTATELSDDRYPTWSPDGAQIAFWSRKQGADGIFEGGIYVMPGLAGSARRLSATRAPPGPPQWSADGNEIAYAAHSADGGGIEILSLSSGETRRIMPKGDPFGVFDLAWSPDGRHFAFIRANGGLPSQITQLILLRVSDGEEIELTDGLTNVWSPAWRDGGRALAYVSNRGGPRDLWIQPLNEDGTPVGEPDAVTTGVEILSASFSAEGDKLAYSKGRHIANVWRVPLLEEGVATWSDAEQITHDQAFVEFLAVSPDGSQLAMSSDRAGNPDLWILPSSGGEIRPLTTDPAPDWDLEFSPDGEEVVFYSYRSGNRDIWIVPTEGGAARQLTDHPARDSYPTFSPDGNQIAFNSQRGTTASDIWLLTLATGELEQLTSEGFARTPYWSQNGWIVFDTGSELWRVSPNGGEPEFLSEVRGNSTASPDGRMLFSDFSDGSGNVWVLDPETKETRAVTDLDGRPGALSGSAIATDGDYVYFTWAVDVGDIWVADVIDD